MYSRVTNYGNERYADFIGTPSNHIRGVASISSHINTPRIPAAVVGRVPRPEHLRKHRNYQYSCHIQSGVCALPHVLGVFSRTGPIFGLRRVDLDNNWRRGGAPFPFGGSQ